jgi:hypothetical protein
LGGDHDGYTRLNYIYHTIRVMILPAGSPCGSFICLLSRRLHLEAKSRSTGFIITRRSLLQLSNQIVSLDNFQLRKRYRKKSPNYKLAFHYSTWLYICHQKKANTKEKLPSLFINTISDHTTNYSYCHEVLVHDAPHLLMAIMCT